MSKEEKVDLINDLMVDMFDDYYIAEEDEKSEILAYLVKLQELRMYYETRKLY